MGLQSLSFEEWRRRARPLLKAGVTPDVAAGLIAANGGSQIADIGPTRDLAFSSRLMGLLESVSCFRAGGRFELMYRLAWRSLYENPRLSEDAADPDVRNAILMDSAIRRDVHKMHAFVRFREVLEGSAEAAYFAWFEPEHEILRRGSKFFVKRFPNMRWTIATPEGAAVWDQTKLNFVDSPGPDARPANDRHEDLWRMYYRSICNVARINPMVMQREMPQKYWKNLPEAAEIGILIRDGLSNFTGRHKESQERGTSMSKAVKRALAELPSANDGPQDCRRCDLWRHATQAVVGEGSKDARMVLVGEQPGDDEDLRGQPFVGPAGRVLNEVLGEAGISRSSVFITNAVKHFKWEPRGKRRLHKKPDVREINACHVWLEKELSQINPAVLVALGASALRSLTGSALSIDAARRQILSHASGAEIVATYHPSAILRADGERAAQLRALLIEDLARARDLADVSRRSG